MKRKILVGLTACCLLITGCKKNQNNNQTSETYVYNSFDEINIHALLSEKSFDLKNYVFVVGENQKITADSNEISWSANNDNVEIKNGKVEFKKEGYSRLTGTYYGYNYYINVLINSKKENRYLFKEIKDSDFNDFVIKTGSMSNVSMSNNSLTLNGYTSGSRVKIDYPMPEGFDRDYIIEADLKFEEAMNNSRWTGISFRSNKEASYPYYQMDVRYNAMADSGVECTELDMTNTFVYADTTSLNYSFNSSDTFHLKVDVSGWNAKFYINDELIIDTPLNNLTKGNIGFQVDNCKVTYSNIKIYMNDNTITNTMDGLSSYVKEKSNKSAILPRMVVGSKTSQEIGTILQGRDFTSIYLKTKLENNDVVVTSMDNNKYIDFFTLIPLIRGSLIPVIEIEDKETAEKVATLMNSFGYDDATIISSNVEVLETYRKLNLINRLGYISNRSSYNSYSDIADDCAKIAKLNGTIVIVDAKSIKKADTQQFNARGFALWAISRDGSYNDVVKAAVNGATMIISENKDACLNAYNLFEDDALLRRPVITAHRGNGTNGTAGVYPENSIESYNYAVENGANAIETDIHMTSDGELVVIHDETTNRTSTCSLTVKNSTLAQLTACYLKSSDTGSATTYKIPSFKQLLEEYKDRDTVLVIEIKDNQAITGLKAIQMLKQYNMMDRAAFIGFATTSIKEVKKTAPELAVGYLNSVNMKNFGDYQKTASLYFNQGIGLSPNYGYLDTEGVLNSNVRGNVYWAWTFSNNIDIFTKMKMGNLCFTTNYPSVVKDWNIDVLTSQNEYQTTTNGTIDLNVKLRNYLDNETATNDYKIKVVSGNDVIEVNGNQIKGLKSGEAYILVEYSTVLNAGNASGSFHIYSDLVKIVVA